jgi:glycosyltransferase involved in cell wall biosynthesis
MFIATKLAQAGLRVDLVVARNVGELRDEPLPGVNRVELGTPNEILAAPRWVRYLRRVRPRCAMSMIHSANFNSGLGALLVPEVPVIVNLRKALDCHPAAQWWLRSWFGFGPERALYKRAARVVGVSKGVAEEATAMLDLPADRVSSVPNPRRSCEASSDIPAEHEPFFERPVVLGVGRLAPQKGFGLLLTAFAEVAKERDLHLVLAGEGPGRHALSRKAAALGVRDRVFLPGFVPNPQAYMRRARVFALASCNEGCPNALIEAMDAGAAIVATNCRFGPHEILDGGRFGALVPVGDASAFAAALAVELDQPDVGRDTRKRARAAWMKRHDPDVMTRRYLELVQDVIAESEPAVASGAPLNLTAGPLRAGRASGTTASYGRRGLQERPDRSRPVPQPRVDG